MVESGREERVSSYQGGKEREEAVGSATSFRGETIVSGAHMPVGLSSNV